MRIDLHLFIEPGSVLAKLDELFNKQDIANAKLENIMIDTTKIRASVAQEVTENASLRTLLRGAIDTMADLSKQLAAAIAANDPAALAQVQADLDTAASELDADDEDTAAAIAAATTTTPMPAP